MDLRVWRASSSDWSATEERVEFSDGDLLAVVMTASGLVTYVRNSGTYATAIITGGDELARLQVAIATYEIASQPGFVYQDQTGNLRASTRVLGGARSRWTACRIGGGNAPYGGYLEAMRPVLEISSRDAMARRGL